MRIWILIFVCMFSMPLLVAGLYFKMKKGQILKIRQDYVKEKCQIFWKKLFCSGGKSPSGNEEWYDHAFKTGKGVGSRWIPGVCTA